jgi:hypothetical protein
MTRKPLDADLLPPTPAWTDADLDAVLDGLRIDTYYDSLGRIEHVVEQGHYAAWRKLSSDPVGEFVDQMARKYGPRNPWGWNGWDRWTREEQLHYIDLDNIRRDESAWVGRACDQELAALHLALAERMKTRLPEWAPVIDWLHDEAVSRHGEAARGLKMIANLPLSAGQMDQLARQCQWCGDYQMMKRGARDDGIMEIVHRLAPRPVDDRYRPAERKPKPASVDPVSVDPVSVEPSSEPAIQVQVDTSRAQEQLRGFIDQMREYARPHSIREARRGWSERTSRYVIDEAMTWTMPQRMEISEESREALRQVFANPRVLRFDLPELRNGDTVTFRWPPMESEG